MVEKGGIVSAKLCTLLNFFMYRTLNTNKQGKYKDFLHEVEGPRYQKSRIEVSQVLVTLPEEQSAPRGPKQDPPGRLSGDFRIHKLEKKEKRSILPYSVKSIQHIRSKEKLDTFVNSALFCFTKGLVL
jgi:hypothetical protein